MKKTLAEKRRHLLVDTNAPLDTKMILNEVKEQYVKFFGVFGLADANVYVSIASGKLILSCKNTEKDKLIFVLASANKINGERVYFRTKKVSGTINALLKAQ